MGTVILGEDLSIEKFIEIAVFHSKVEFSQEYRERVRKSREIIEACVEKEAAVYGTTTGFGALVSQFISKEEAELLQKNIILTHSVSVGNPLKEEEVGAVILMVLQSLGKGVSGVRLEVLERYREFLNKNLIPYVPGEGSVGYLCAEAHIGAVLIGEGRAWYQGELMAAEKALKAAGMEPLTLSYKEGLALINGTTSPTALAALAVYRLAQAAETADVVAAMSLEGLKGQMRAYDSHVTKCRPQKELEETAENLKALLAGSEVVKKWAGSHLQDPLSLRCIPQLHGAAKRILKDAWEVVSCEINACGDNPVVYGSPENPEVYSNGNPDASYVGMEMDAACIAAGNLAKMSERRNARFLDQNLSGLPSFLVKNPGLNSGLMIPQYAQAGLLNTMRMLAVPATADSVSTSAGQEDYVSMGYNACKKAAETADKLEYILAVEALSAYQAQFFIDENLKRGKGTSAVYEEMKKKIPAMEKDMYIYPWIQWIKEWIHEGGMLDTAWKAADKKA